MRNFKWMCLVLFMGLCAHAEIRVWTDTKGKTYEAEFVREMFDKVTLRDTKGTEYRLAVGSLSDHDQKYLRVMIPPEMEINFSKKTDPKPKPWELYDSDNDTTDILTATVEIHKASKRPFTSRLRAELFLIAEEIDGDNYLLLSKTESSFLFSDQNDNTFVMKADPVEIMVFTEYNHQRRGWAYLGHVLAVSDAQGNVVKVDTDIEWLADKTANLRDLYTRGEAALHSRHFDKENVQKTPPPRPDYYLSRQR